MGFRRKSRSAREKHKAMIAQKSELISMDAINAACDAIAPKLSMDEARTLVAETMGGLPMERAKNCLLLDPNSDIAIRLKFYGEQALKLHYEDEKQRKREQRRQSAKAKIIKQRQLRRSASQEARQPKSQLVGKMEPSQAGMSFRSVLLSTDLLDLIDVPTPVEVCLTPPNEFEKTERIDPEPKIPILQNPLTPDEAKQLRQQWEELYGREDATKIRITAAYTPILALNPDDEPKGPLHPESPDEAATPQSEQP